MGFIYLALGIAYVIISAIIILLGGWIVKAFGKRPRRWYIGATIVSFLILFWDFPPTYIMFKYYCNNKAGLRVHETLSDWRRAHPGIFETLTPAVGQHWVKKDGVSRIRLNDRFILEQRKRELLFYIIEKRDLIRDGVEGNVLYEMVNYQVTNHLGEPEVFRDYKIWLTLGACTSDKSILKEQINFNSLESIVGRKK